MLRGVDLAVLLAYLVAVLALGCWFARRSRTTTSSFTAVSWPVGKSSDIHRLDT